MNGHFTDHQVPGILPGRVANNAISRVANIFSRMSFTHSIFDPAELFETEFNFQMEFDNIYFPSHNDSPETPSNSEHPSQKTHFDDLSIHLKPKFESGKMFWQCAFPNCRKSKRK
jgi:hypothetical protein